jgi:hypothetical protein
VQFHITENVQCLDFHSVGKTVCQPQHCPPLVWRVEIWQKPVRSLHKFTAGRHALTLQIAHLLTSRKEKGTTGLRVFTCIIPHSFRKSWKNASGQERDASRVFTIRTATLTHSVKAVGPGKTTLNSPNILHVFIHSFVYCGSNARNSIRQQPFSESVSRSAGQEIPLLYKMRKITVAFTYIPLPDLNMSQPQFN